MANLFTNAGNAISAALGGKPAQADPGTRNKVGYDSRPIPIPDSVRAARQKMFDQIDAAAKARQQSAAAGGSPMPANGMEAAMHAPADKLHPVK